MLVVHALISLMLWSEPDEQRLELDQSLEHNIPEKGKPHLYLKEILTYEDFLQAYDKPQTTSQNQPFFDTSIDVSAQYDVRKLSPITAEKLDAILGGVLKGEGKHFVRFGRKYGIDPAFLAAIAIHETGNGTSKAVRNLNNVGGIMKGDGVTLREFQSLEESIETLAKILYDLYIPNGRTTPKAIQAWYAPIGVENDPTNLNQHWVGGVVHYWKEIRKNL